MRKITIGLMSTLSGLVLLFSYHTSTNSGTALADSGSTGGPTGGTATAPSDAPDTAAPGTAASASTYTGDPVMTRWGIVQVRIAVANGKITKSEAVQYPQENHRDVEINAYAVPALDEAAVAAQSANIDAVSGATVTSEGYVESLQSAIDQAHL